MVTKPMRSTLMGLSVLCVAVLIGCGAGGSNVDTTTPRGAVLGWAQALETGDTQEISNLAPEDYAYDGAGLATDSSGVQAPRGPGMPAWMGGDGTTTIEILSLEETSPTTAIARVSVQYVGTMGYGGGMDYGGSGGEPASGGDDANGGAGDGSTDNEREREGEEPGFSSPGFSGPPPPSVDRPETQNGAMAATRSASPRTPMGRQLWGGSQFSYTAILVLGLEKISDVWFIVSQRQEMSSTLMGNGATAPVFDELTVTPSPALPGSSVTVAGSVHSATGDVVTVRIGWQYAQLELSGGSFSGDVRTPRHEGTYIVEAEATNSSGDAWGSGTRSAEIVLEGEPIPSYTLDTQTSVDPAIEAALRQYISGVRDPDWQNYENSYADALAVVADDYAYNGEGEWGSVWASGIQSSESTDLAATITQAAENGGVYSVVLETTQQSIGGWGYGYDIAAPMMGGGATGGGGSSDGGEAMAPAPDAAPRQFYIWGDVVAHGSVLFEFESRGGEWLITAVRTRSGWSAPDEISVPPLTLVTNGGEALDVVGGSPVTVQGTLTGWQGGGYYNAGLGYNSWAYGELAGDGLTAELTAPGPVGRWVLSVSAELIVDSQEWKTVSAYASEEVRVTVAGPDDPSGGGDGSTGVDEPPPPDEPGDEPVSNTDPDQPR